MGIRYGLIAFLLIGIGVLVYRGVAPEVAANVVVVYTSVDQHHAEPILAAFTAATGIKVLPVFDIEATKTTGLVNRLLAERARPQADCFWNGEFAQTLYLAEQGLLAEKSVAPEAPAGFAGKGWSSLGARARVLLVNTERLKPEMYPGSIEDFLGERYPADQIAIANPVFGTTATHAAALFAAWGEDRTLAFFAKLKERGVRVVDGNSVVRDLVANGSVMWGLTDTDDALGAIERKAPVVMVLPDQRGAGGGTLIIPATVALLRGAPHPAAAEAFLAYLRAPETAREMERIGWSQLSQLGGVWHFGAEQVKPLPVTLEQVGAALPRAQAALREQFVK